jgi:hypothetical protein
MIARELDGVARVAGDEQLAVGLLANPGAPAGRPVDAQDRLGDRRDRRDAIDQPFAGLEHRRHQKRVRVMMKMLLIIHGDGTHDRVNDKGLVTPSEEYACQVPVTVANWACWPVAEAFSKTALARAKTTAPPV